MDESREMLEGAIQQQKREVIETCEKAERDFRRLARASRENAVDADDQKKTIYDRRADYFDAAANDLQRKAEHIAKDL